MTSFRFLEFLVFLLLPQVYSEEAEFTVRAEGSIMEMGYCFGVDYIVVYRCVPEGDQLLGNSSVDSQPITPPPDLQGRVRFNQQDHLLGLQISNLTHMDSGIYRRECWKNQIRVSHHTQQLSVCNEEIQREEIIVKEGDGTAQLLCNSASIGLNGTSVRWYYEMYPSYRLTLFLDSSVSLHPLLTELHGGVDVKRGGALLLVDGNLLKNNQHFYCLVIKGKNCIGFKNMHLPDHSESTELFVSQGERLVLSCPSDGANQKWETPLGNISRSSTRNNQMYISFGEKSEDYSLVISAITDKHSGIYTCISLSSEVEYSLNLCPSKDPQNKNVQGGEVSLECDVGQDNDEKVQWYRQEHELIHDSDDVTVPVPEDLRGRLSLSKNSSRLTLADLKVEDEGMYWCVVVGSEFLDDYDAEEHTEEDNHSDDEYWPDTHRCISKQKYSVSMRRTTDDPQTSPPDDPPEPSNVAVYGLVAGLAGVLLLVGVTAAVIITMKKRAKVSKKQRGTQCGNTRKDIKMDEDPGCTQRLTHNDESAA